MYRLSALAVCSLAGLLLGASAAVADDHPLIKEVKSQLKDTDKPFTMVVTIKVKADAGAKLEAAFDKAIAPTRKEKGCLRYELNRDAKEPTTYVLYERWKDLAALEAHLKSDHITKLLEAIGDLTDGTPELKVLMPVGD